MTSTVYGFDKAKKAMKSDIVAKHSSLDKNKEAGVTGLPAKWPNKGNQIGTTV